MPANKEKNSAVYAAIKQEMALKGHKVSTDWIRSTIKALDEPVEVFDALVAVLSKRELPLNTENIPAYPQALYRHTGWKGWGDFLGHGSIEKFETARKQAIDQPSTNGV